MENLRFFTVKCSLLDGGGVRISLSFIYTSHLKDGYTIDRDQNQ